MKMRNRYVLVCAAFLFLAAASFLGAQEADQVNGRLSVHGGVGISGARGDYPSEYDARVEFSFNPGLRAIWCR